MGVRGYCGCRLETLEVDWREGGSERVLQLSNTELNRVDGVEQTVE